LLMIPPPHTSSPKSPLDRKSTPQCSVVRV
jgi:hypothetical protein